MTAAAGAPSAPATSATVPRLAGIEGLRAVAATSIVVYHVWLYSNPSDSDWTTAGWTTWLVRFVPDLAFGVTLFFTLSGFLLYRPFAAAILRGQRRPRFSRYFRNRALRIVPAYWAFFLFFALVLGAVLLRTPDGHLIDGSEHDPQRLVVDMLLLQHYRPSTVVTGIGPAWSLAVEVAFYVMLPLLVLLAWALGRRAGSRASRLLAALAPAIVLLGVGLSGKLASEYLVPGSGSGGWGADWHSVLERSFVGQADLFSFGMALAIVRVEAEDGRLVLGRRGRRLVGTAAVLLFVGSVRSGNWEALGNSPYNTLVALSCALLLALVVLPDGRQRAPALVRVLEKRPLVWVGVVSYSLFLAHEPLIRWLHDHNLTFGGLGGLAANVLVAGGLALALAGLSYRFVERPALRRKRRAAQPAASAPTGAAAAPAPQ